MSRNIDLNEKKNKIKKYPWKSKGMPTTNIKKEQNSQPWLHNNSTNLVSYYQFSQQN
jgi:hypothetical protein